MVIRELDVEDSSAVVAAVQGDLEKIAAAMADLSMNLDGETDFDVLRQEAGLLQPG